MLLTKVNPSGSIKQNYSERRKNNMSAACFIICILSIISIICSLIIVIRSISAMCRAEKTVDDNVLDCHISCAY